jgi:hypothetical protein
VDRAGRAVERPRDATEPYAVADEAFIGAMQSLQWNRDDGIIELMPIAVVHRI